MTTARTLSAKEVILKHFGLNPSQENLALDTLATEYADLFNLDGLADEIWATRTDASKKTKYFKLFSFIFNEVKGETGNGQAAQKNILTKIQDRLNNTSSLAVSEYLLSSTLVRVKLQETKADNPDQPLFELGADSEQIGYIEKLGSKASTLDPLEPLSRLDLLRVILPTQNYLFSRLSNIEITSRSTLESQGSTTSGKCYIINMEQDPHKAPCWLFLNTQDSTVYCQKLLDEYEKGWLQKINKGRVPTYDPEGQGISDGVTSGYALLNWFDRKILKNRNAEEGSDAFAQRHEFVRGYPSGLALDSYDRQFCQTAYTRLAPLKHFYYLSRSSWLGEFNVEGLGKFKSNNLSDLIRQMEEKNLSIEDMAKYWEIGMRINLNGLPHVLKNLADHRGKKILLQEEKTETVSFLPNSAHFDDVREIGTLFQQSGWGHDGKQYMPRSITSPCEIYAMSSIPSETNLPPGKKNTFVFYTGWGSKPTAIYFVDRSGLKPTVIQLNVGVYVAQDLHTQYQPSDRKPTPLTSREVDTLSSLATFPLSKQDMVECFLLGFFRSFATEKVLHLQIPADLCQVHPQETQFIITLMLNNWRVTQVQVNDSNQSLVELRKALVPTMARNRWLNQPEFEYRPRQTDNHWLNAAYFWLTYLSKEANQDVLEYSQLQAATESKKHGQHYSCITEMGIKGLESLIENLETRRSMVEAIFGSKKKALYVNCLGKEFEDYLSTLNNYLADEGHYFPFSSVALSFKPEYASKGKQSYVDLLTTLNTRGGMDEIVIFDYLNQDKDPEKFLQAKGPQRRISKLESFLTSLIEQTKAHKWATKIRIPELEDKKTLTETYKTVRALYATLNNHLLENQRALRVTALKEELSRPREELEAAAAQAAPLPSAEHKDSALEVKAADEDEKKSTAAPLKPVVISGIKKEGRSWPLTKSFGASLQQQQQQQQMQVQQQQNQQQMQVDDEIEEQEEQQRNVPFTSRLVDYKNVDELLGDYYRQYKLEHPEFKIKMDPEFKETELQCFFRTCISANPYADQANSVFHKMTQAAARFLLQNFNRFGDGTDFEALPLDFWRQIDAQNKNVLCYNPGEGYQKERTDYTVNLGHQPAKAANWRGDGRQFDLAAAEKTGLDTQAAVLFQNMQPQKKAIEDECRDYLSGPTFGLTQTQKTKHLIAALQHWHCDRISGFRTQNDRQLELDPKAVWKALLGETNFNRFLPWFQTHSWHFWNLKNLVALGQVYNKYGQEGVALFVEKLESLDNTFAKVDDEFFGNFKKNFIDTSENLCELLNAESFYALEDLKTALKGDEEGRELWKALTDKHIENCKWESLTAVWQAFNRFNSITLKQGHRVPLTLDAEKVRQLDIRNMLVFLARTERALSHIDQEEAKQDYLDKLKQVDLKHGGAHYALQYEKFKIHHTNLDLKNFNAGKPTYTPPLSDIYNKRSDSNWEMKNTALFVRRALAQWPEINLQRYKLLTEGNLFDDSKASKDALILLLTTQFSGNNEQLLECITDLKTTPPLSPIAEHLQEAVYKSMARPDVTLNSILRLVQAPRECQYVLSTLGAWPQGVALEAVSLLAGKHEDKTAFEKDVRLAMTGLFSQAISTTPRKSQQQIDSLKLATLFGVFSSARVNALIAKLNEGIAISPEIESLFIQLLSVKLPADEASLSAAFEEIIKAVGEVQSTRVREKQKEACTTLIETLEGPDYHLGFRIGPDGGYTRLIATDYRDEFFSGPLDAHKDQIWKFLMERVMVPIKPGVRDQAPTIKKALKHVLQFFTTLALKNVEVDEMGLLFIAFEQIPKGLYWSSDNMQNLLRTVEPGDYTKTYPLSLLTLLFRHPDLTGRPEEEVAKDYPSVIFDAVQGSILNTDGFTRPQHVNLCRVLLGVYTHSKDNLELFNAILQQSKDLNETYREIYLRSAGNLGTLCQKDGHLSLLQGLQNAQEALKDVLNAVINNDLKPMSDSLTETYRYWLLAQQDSFQKELFEQLQQHFSHDSERFALVLHIMAWSTLHKGFRDAAKHEDELLRKANKLITGSKSYKGLKDLDTDDLYTLARLYPTQPMPTTDQLRRILKKADEMAKMPENDLLYSEALEQRLDHYRQDPHALPRPDFGAVPATRQEDLKRILRDMRLNEAKDTKKKSIEYHRLLQAFDLLKRLEDGKEFIAPGITKAPQFFTDDELKDAINHLRGAVPSVENRTKMWALLFEVLYKTTKKYPHMAQQLGILSLDLCLTADMRAIQLATGEGKSHIIAMRAAFYALYGYEVDVCTSNRSLASRDHKDYQSFFKFLDLPSAYINDSALPEKYTEASIRYSTMGDLSLFLDHAKDLGKSITIHKAKRVGLFDEFDYMRFEENYNTQYNYAAFSGNTAHRMLWFYRAVDAYYRAGQTRLRADNKVTEDDLERLLTILVRLAGKDENKKAFVASLAENNNSLALWLQAAHTAHTIEMNKDFVLIGQEIVIIGESYQMKEIIPLSMDNQRVVGSSFSEGVHQLLAIRLHTQPNPVKDVYVSDQNYIVSSQIAETRMSELFDRQEAMTGTLEQADIESLQELGPFQVLQGEMDERYAKIVSSNHFPTNKPTLRDWKEPTFHADTDEQLEAAAKQIKEFFLQKKSFLIACPNDKAVLALKDRLEKAGYFKPGELDSQFIFSTNADNRDVEAILSEKNSKEQKVNGRRQNGVALGTSAMGRGENPDVDGVILFHLASETDLIQSGGRTARIGEEGAVYQFLNMKELMAEYEKLRASVTRLRSALSAITSGKPVTPNEAKQDEVSLAALTKKILKLRKEEQRLQRFTTQSYRVALSQASTWGMDLLAKLQAALKIKQDEALKNADPSDPDDKKKSTIDLPETLRQEWIRIIKALNESWIQLGSDQAGKRTNELDRLKEIRKEVQKKAEYFAKQVMNAGVPVDPFVLKDLDLKPVHTVDPNANKNLDLKALEAAARQSRLLGDTWVLLYSLGLTSGDDKSVNDIDAFLKTLSQPALQSFYDIVAAERPTKLVSIMNLIEKTKRSVSSSNPPTVEEKLSAKIQNKLDLFDDKHAERLKSLMEKHLDAPQRNIFLSFLERITNDREIEAYIQAFPRLLAETPAHLLETRFETLPPMRLRDFETIWHLTQKIDKESGEVLTMVGGLVLGLTDIELRMFTSWEDMAKYLSHPNEKLDFFKNFCAALKATKSDYHSWDQFKTLITLSSEWWLLDSGAYRPEILNLWQALAKHQAVLTSVPNLLDACLDSKQFIKGKAWFKYLNEVLALDSANLVAHEEALITLLQKVNQVEGNTKADKTLFIREAVAKVADLQHTAIIHELGDNAPKEEQKKQISQLITVMEGYEARVKETLLPAIAEMKQDEQLTKRLHALLNQPQTLAYVNEAAIDEKKLDIITENVKYLLALTLKNDPSMDYIKACMNACPEILGQHGSAPEEKESIISQLTQWKVRHDHPLSQNKALIQALADIRDLHCHGSHDLHEAVGHYSSVLMQLPANNEALTGLLPSLKQNYSHLAVIQGMVRGHSATGTLAQQYSLCDTLTSLEIRTANKALNEEIKTALLAHITGAGLHTALSPEQLKDYCQNVSQSLSKAGDEVGLRAALQNRIACDQELTNLLPSLNTALAEKAIFTEWYLKALEQGSFQEPEQIKHLLHALTRLQLSAEQLNAYSDALKNLLAKAKDKLQEVKLLEVLTRCNLLLANLYRLKNKDSKPAFLAWYFKLIQKEALSSVAFIQLVLNFIADCGFALHDQLPSLLPLDPFTTEQLEQVLAFGDTKAQSWNLDLLQMVESLFANNPEERKDLDLGSLFDKLRQQRSSNMTSRLRDLKQFIEKLPKHTRAQELNHLCQLFLRYAEENSEHEVAILLQNLQSLPHSPKDVNAISILLRNGLIDRLGAHVNEKQQNHFFEVANRFYALAKEAGSDNIQVLDKKLEALFDFSDRKKQQERLAFMHLLYQRSLVLSAGNAADQRWNNDNNDLLLKQCFDRYVKETNRLLAADTKRKLRPKNQHDLSFEQHKALLNLANEMKLIAQEQLPYRDTTNNFFGRLQDQSLSAFFTTKATPGEGFLAKYPTSTDIDPDKRKRLEAVLLKAMKSYSSSWFKSSSRKAQLKDLQARIAAKLGLPTPRYDEILEALRQAKSAAMDSDCQVNKSWFRRYLKGHGGSGKSRYYNTLNQMHEAVLKSWSQDLSAVNSFGQYRDSVESDIKMVASKVCAYFADFAQGASFTDLAAKSTKPDANTLGNALKLTLGSSFYNRHRASKFVKVNDLSKFIRKNLSMASTNALKKHKEKSKLHTLFYLLGMDATTQGENTLSKVVKLSGVIQPASVDKMQTLQDLQQVILQAQQEGPDKAIEDLIKDANCGAFLTESGRALLKVMLCVMPLGENIPGVSEDYLKNPLVLESLSKNIPTLSKDLPGHMVCKLKELQYSAQLLKGHLDEVRTLDEKITNPAMMFRNAV